MRRHASAALAVLFIALAALVSAACAEEDPPVRVTPAPVATPSATVSPTATAAPTEVTATTPTGLAGVDAVIAAVKTKDLARLLDLAAWQEAACETPRGMGPGGPPPCEAGETGGTVVRVFPVAGCEGYFVRDPREPLATFLDEVGALHSVVQAPTYGRPAPYWPVGEIYVNFEAEIAGEVVGRRLVLEDGKVVLVFFGCNHPPALLMEDGGTPLPVIYQPPQ